MRIKWLNDLYVKGFKVGGVFCMLIYSLKKFNIVVGKYDIGFFFGI